MFWIVWALAGPAEDARALVEAGVLAAQEGDGKGAIEAWVQAGELGDHWGYTNASVHYREGIGVPQDLVMACRLTRAARSVTGSPRAVNADPRDVGHAQELHDKTLAIMTAEQKERCEAASIEGLGKAMATHQTTDADGMRLDSAWSAALAAARTVAGEGTWVDGGQPALFVMDAGSGGVALRPLEEEKSIWTEAGLLWHGASIPVPGFTAGGTAVYVSEQALIVAPRRSPFPTWGGEGDERIAISVLPPQAPFDQLAAMVVDERRMAEMWPDQRTTGSVKGKGWRATQAVTLNPRIDGLNFPLGALKPSGVRGRVHHVAIERVVDFDGRVVILAIVAAEQGDAAVAVRRTVDRLDALTHRIRLQPE